MRSESLKGHLDMLLLAALRSAPLHGYAVVEHLREISDGTFDLPENTVYAALYRLERGGLLSSRTTVYRGRRRRVYSLTPTGRRELIGHRSEWEQFVHGVTRTLEAAG